MSMRRSPGCFDFHELRMSLVEVPGRTHGNRSTCFVDSLMGQTSLTIPLITYTSRIFMPPDLGEEATRASHRGSRGIIAAFGVLLSPL